MIYQLVNKKTETHILASSHIGHFCNQFNYVFALLISIPKFFNIKFLKALIFTKIGLKLSYFLQKKKYKIF